MLALYTLVFGGLFGVSWDGDNSAGLAAYAVQLYCGMVVFQIFQECLTRAPQLITAVPNYVKKVVFPLDILPVPVMSAAMFHGCIGSLVVVVVHGVFNHALNWTLLLFPLVWIPLVFWCLGIMWWVAALGVYVRDVQHIVGLGAQILFFASPIIYPLSRVPEPFRQILKLNPLTWIVAGQRAALLNGNGIPWIPLMIVGLTGFVLFISGYAFFQRLRPGFSDVI
jgi:lipopolysaccharide transport system permease protein